MNMTISSEYLDKQRQYWNVSDVETAKFDRVAFVPERTEEQWKIYTENSLGLLFKAVSPQKNWNLLEIGCGVGRLLGPIAQRYPVAGLTGVDISPSMIQFATQALSQYPNVKLMTNSGCDLSAIADQSIQFAYSVDVFIHLADWDLVLNYWKEVKRVLISGGEFRLNVRRFDPNQAFGNSVGGRIAKWLYSVGILSTGQAKWDSKKSGELNGNEYMPRDLKRLAKESGLILQSLEAHPEHFWLTLKKP